MSPGAMQDVATKPRQIRKEATVATSLMCRGLPDPYFIFLWILRPTQNWI